MTALSPSHLTLDVRPRWWHDIGRRYLALLGLVLMGYALDGRGFAYLGLPPIFIGELSLVAGLLVLAGTSGWAMIWSKLPILSLAAFILFGVVRTIPYFGRYGMDTLRDAAIYYYSLFAFIVAGLVVAQPQRLLGLLRHYRFFAKAFLVLIPVVAATYRFGHDALPRWPGSDIPMIQEKEGDVMVHLGGVVAFWMSELAMTPAWGWSVLLAMNAACMGVIDRAGLVAFSAAVGVGFVHRPRSTVGLRMIGAIAAAIVLLALTGVHVEIPGGKGRELSFKQIVTNLKSTVGDADNDGLDSTKEWRTQWWKDIVVDVIHGGRFWGGCGFGVNLADEYGYQVQQDHSLRSPHSAHMTVLARMGAPGLVLWAVVQLSWAGSILNAYWRARMLGDAKWSALLMFLGAFWLAFLINSSFDVFLEGPMGGIWFWSVYGAGVAALCLYERQPELLYCHANSCLP